MTGLIDERARAAARRVVEFATSPENHYVPGPGAKIPGVDPNHVLMLHTYRCVFAISVVKGRRWKHLSVAVPVRDKAPPPDAFEEIAHLFGITGGLNEWAALGYLHPNKDENAIAVVQLLDPDS